MLKTIYFLGANSPDGFCSLYDELSYPDGRIYILKGGPGCGKSTFMRSIAERAEKAGRKVEYIICSADPDSLDGIVIGDREITFVDGTAPHVMEPMYPAAVENYINLGEFYNESEVVREKDRLIEMTAEYKGIYRDAYEIIAAAGKVFGMIRSIVCTSEFCEKAEKRAKGISKKEVKKAKLEGTVKRRFLRGITAQGEMCRFDTVSKLCSRVYEISDNYGLSHIMLEKIAEDAKKYGYDVIECMDPMFPDKIEHLILPGLKLGFVCSSRGMPYEGAVYRKIRLDFMAEKWISFEEKQQIKRLRKIYTELMREAMLMIRDAKAIHDDIEMIYHPYIDFEKVTALADATADKILL